MRVVATFSIAAYDPTTESWGVAVQSKFLAAAAVVSWARAGAGAVATQSYANMDYGPDGLDLMQHGASAEETIHILTTSDSGRDQRQVGMVDREGRAHSYTGAGCNDWAGHIIGDGYCCQGNILVPGTVEAMFAAYARARQGAGELADWLVSALAAGQAAGGDSRGRQAAGVLVVKENGGYGGRTDRYIDLRVDDDPRPIARLGEILAMHHLFFGSVDPSDLIPMVEARARLTPILTRLGHLKPGADSLEAFGAALRILVGNENLEERWDGTDCTQIDRLVVDYLERRLA